MMIDIDDLLCNPLSTYYTSETQQKNLITSMQFCGVLQALLVIGPTNEGKYILISGERRYRAAKTLVEGGDERFKALPCSVIGPADMDEDLQVIYIENSNLCTRNFNHMDHTKKYGALIRDKFGEEEGTRQLMSMLDCSENYARIVLGLNGRRIK